MRFIKEEKIGYKEHNNQKICNHRVLKTGLCAQSFAFYCINRGTNQKM